MKKLGCAKCGGTKKMQKGGMKTTVGSKTAKTFIAGMPNSGPTGPNYQGIDTMKTGGTKVQHSCPPGYVRSASGTGCVPMGKRSTGGTKMQDGGSATSKKLTRLGTKVEKKTAAGKTIGKGLQKRYDKAVDKVIVRGMTKAKRGGIKK